MDGILLLVAVLCVGTESPGRSGETINFYIEPPRKTARSAADASTSDAAQHKDPKLLPPEKPIYPIPRPAEAVSGRSGRAAVVVGAGGCPGALRPDDSTGQQHAIAFAANSAAARRCTGQTLEDARLNDIYFIDARQGWAVGDRGVIWHTEDGGRNWRFQHAGVDCSLRSVFFIDEKTGWVAGGFTHPYTHTSRGVLLFTRDGGRNWQLHDKLLLPALRKIRFFCPRRGWAIGVRSDLYPSGLFFTSDGGLSWSPSGSGTGGDWTCGDMFSPGNGALAGRMGSMAVVRAAAAQLVSADYCLFQNPQQLRFFGPNRGWLVGDGGLVRSTSDQGQTWQRPQRLPPSLAQFDLATVAIRHDKIWLAGAPGTRIWHSPDGGRTWQWSATGVRTPLHAVCFADDQHGWAAGSLGTILATEDGGRTWRVQRSAGSRVAVLIMVAQLEDVPLELIARLSGDEGYLSAVKVLHRRDWQSPWQMAMAPAERLHEAVVAVGGCEGLLAWQFPVRAPELRLPAAQMLVAWHRLHVAVWGEHDAPAAPPQAEQHDPAGPDRWLTPEAAVALRALRAHLLRQIRMWRPEIIITNDAAPQGHDPLRHLVNQAVLQAVYQAADRRCFAEQIDQASLEPWEVKKLYAVVPSQDRGSIELDTAQLALRLGCTIAEAAAPARGLLLNSSVRCPEKLGFRLLVNNLPAAEAQRDRDFASGVELLPGSDGRRRLAQPAAENLAALHRLAQQQRNVQAIIQRIDGDARGGANLLGQLGEMTLRLEPAAAAHNLHRLADRYCGSGRWDLGADCLRMLAQRYPEHPLAGPATVWLVQYYGSTEVGWRLRNPHRPGIRLISTLPAETPSAETPSAETPSAETPSAETPSAETPSAEALGPLGKPGNMPQQALALGEHLQSTRPELAAMPAVAFPLAAAERCGVPAGQSGRTPAASTGAALESSAISAGVQGTGKLGWLQRAVAGRGGELSSRDPWEQCRLGERWIAAGRGQPPKPLIDCVKAPARPKLDAWLDDPLWQASKPVALCSPWNDDDSWPATVALAYDEQFLYLAVKCRVAPGLKYPPAATPRTRDANLAASDRVDFFLDVDRDYVTCYRLSVDYRGFTAEECWGDTLWNPTWFVAAARDGETWCVEAAIPMVELVPVPPRKGDVWAVGVQRVVPSVGLQSFHETADLPYAPECCAYLVFQ